MKYKLLGELIRALGVASQKGLSAQHQAAIIARAASVADINLLYPLDPEDREITAKDVVAYLGQALEEYEQRNK